MSRNTDSRIIVRGLHLFVIVFLLVGVFCLTPWRVVQAAMPTEPSDFLQFRAAGHVLGFQAEGVYVAAGDHMFKVEFVGTQGVKPVADQMPSGEGQTRPLGRVTFANLWPGISLSYEHVAGGIVQSSYLLEPGADVEQIRLCYNAPVKIEDGGNLRIGYKTGQMRESAPVAWQNIKGRRILVDVAFCLLESPIRNSMVGFRLGRYNSAYPLMIDPTLQWNTFMGSPSDDDGYAIALDSSGNVYVAGRSDASWGMPVNAHTGVDYNAFVAKLDSDGVRQWHTFMGSSVGYAIAVGGSGNVYVAGTSGDWGTPVIPHAGNNDAFVAKLDSDGLLQWHTFMGGSGQDSGRAIALDGSEDIYVVGTSNATWGTPVIPHAGNDDAFAAKLNNNGVRQWHTFMGSSTIDVGYAIALDGNDNVYVAGRSDAEWGSPENPHAGGPDAFAAKLNNSGVRQWNTFMGSTNQDEGYGIAVDSSGNVYVAGHSLDTWGSPVNDYAGDFDAFAARLSSTGLLQWNTFMRSNFTEWGYAIALDGSGNVYVAGGSLAPGDFQAFVTKLDSNGAEQWNKFLGSGYFEEGRAIAVDDSDNVYVAGNSSANWGPPVNPHSGSAGTSDAFAAKIAPGSGGDGGGGCFIVTAVR